MHWQLDNHISGHPFMKFMKFIKNDPILPPPPHPLTHPHHLKNKQLINCLKTIESASMWQVSRAPSHPYPLLCGRYKFMVP